MTCQQPKQVSEHEWVCAWSYPPVQKALVLSMTPLDVVIMHVRERDQIAIRFVQVATYQVGGDSAALRTNYAPSVEPPKHAGAHQIKAAPTYGRLRRAQCITSCCDSDFALRRHCALTYAALLPRDEEIMRSASQLA